jgi:hypothetical protein
MQCHSAECRVLFMIMLSVVRLNVVRLSVVAQLKHILSFECETDYEVKSKFLPMQGLLELQRINK